MAEKFTYSNVTEEAQPVVWKMFRFDEILKGFTTNILDKEPEELNRGVGYPYFIIPEPEIGDDRIVTFRKHELVLFFNCSVYTITTPAMRKMTAAIRACIAKNRTFLRSYGLNNATVESRTHPYPTDDGKMAYRADVVIRMETVVDGSEGDE